MKQGVPAYTNSLNEIDGVYTDIQETTLYIQKNNEMIYQISIAEVDSVVFDIPVSNITFNKPALSLEIGDSETLIATIDPSFASNKIITWSSSNTDVATVSNNGNITGISVGYATITATVGGVSQTCVVTVGVPVTEILISPTTLTLEVGKTYRLTATVLPDNATNKTVQWASPNYLNARVNSSGVITAMSPGSVPIVAIVGDVRAYCSLTVVFVPVTDVTLSASTLSLEVGSTSILSAAVVPSNATDKALTWSSNNTGVATVSSTGKVTAIAAGGATITVKAGNISKTCWVTVSNIPVSEVMLSATTHSLEVGKTATLTAAVLPNNATNKTVTWSSSNTKIATVSSSGEVTAIAGGTATITAKAGNKTATCTVSVIVPITGLTLLPAVSVGLNTSSSLTATVVPSNTTTDKTITWTNSNPNIATITINSNGNIYIKGISVGYTTITATVGEISKNCLVTVGAPVTSLTLSSSAITIEPGSFTSIVATVLPSVPTNKTITWSSSNPMVASVSSSSVITAEGDYDNRKGISSGVVTVIAVGTTTITVQAGDFVQTCIVTVEKLPEWVLINGVKWANHNVASFGYFTSIAEACGKLYRWGGGQLDLSATIYCTDRPKSEAWQKVTDPSPSGYRVPNSDEMKSLLDVNNVAKEWITVGGVKGLRFTDKTSGNSMFLPSVNITYSPKGTCDFGGNAYWTSSRGGGYNGNGVFYMDFGDTYTNMFYSEETGALSIRSVVDEIIPVTNVTLSTTAITLETGTSATLTAAVLPSIATNKTLTWSSSNTDVATVSSSGVVTAKTTGTTTITATAEGISHTCIVTVPSEWVLINGVKWATRNVDKPNTFTASSEHAGMFYLWGSNLGISCTNPIKYSDSNVLSIIWGGFTTSKSIWDKTNDPSPTGFRVPTRNEMQLLLDETKVTSVWTTQNGIAGRKFTDRTTGNSMFLPSVGFRSFVDGSLNSSGVFGYYWSGTAEDNLGCGLGFGNNSIEFGSGNCGFGGSVRSVFEE
ncbi:MAG: Ig-like domain-containing protein [Bacteroidales bacterium]|nr:Ig-like domain-containing protein [Bacteroidales bacterium]